METIPTNTTKELITKSDTAKRFKVSTRTIDNWVSEGKIPSIKIGLKTIRFDWNAVMNSIKAID
jgi:excisionase family DNA binding protein